MRKKVENPKKYKFFQTDENKAFNASLFKAIVGTASCVNEINIHKSGKDSFLETICLLMDLEPNKNTIRKIVKNYDQKTKLLVLQHFNEQLTETMDEPPENIEISVPLIEPLQIESDTVCETNVSLQPSDVLPKNLEVLSPELPKSPLCQESTTEAVVDSEKPTPEISDVFELSHSNSNSQAANINVEENLLLPMTKISNSRQIRDKVNHDWIEMDEVLVIPNDDWAKAYNPDTKKLNSHFYTNIVAHRLSSIVGCVINIKGCDYLKNSITIRAYCAHTKDVTDPDKKCRNYVLRSIKSIDEGHFKIKHSNVDPTDKHVKIITRHLNKYARGASIMIIKQCVLISIENIL